MTGVNSHGGLLTPSQRELLENPDEMTDQQRYRLRRRIRQGITDFAYLANRLPPKERELIFEQKGGQKDADFYNGLWHMFQFAYLGVPDAIDFEQLLEGALYDAEVRQHRDAGTVTEVGVTIETRQRYDLDEAESKFRNGELMTFEEIGALAAADRLAEDEFPGLVEHARERGIAPRRIPQLFSRAALGDVLENLGDG